MPKDPGRKRKAAAQGSPYAKSGTIHNLFKMKTEIGQHVLKNPGVAQAIVDKADLKQSDVGFYSILFLRRSFFQSKGHDNLTI